MQQPLPALKFTLKMEDEEENKHGSLDMAATGEKGSSYDKGILESTLCLKKKNFLSDCGYNQRNTG